MRTIMSIIKHEVKAKFFSWITLIFFLMLVFQGIWYTKGVFDYYINDNVLMNAPAIFYKNFAGLGMLMVVIIAISTGGVLYKDIQYKSAQWIYSLPLNEKQFFLGRFLSAFIYLLIVSAGFFVGMLIVPHSGIGEAHRFGPVPIGQMLHGVLIFLIPNILLYISAIFASITIFRQMAGDETAIGGNFKLSFVPNEKWSIHYNLRGENTRQNGTFLLGQNKKDAFKNEYKINVDKLGSSDRTFLSNSIVVNYFGENININS